MIMMVMVMMVMTMMTNRTIPMPINKHLVGEIILLQIKIIRISMVYFVRIHLQVADIGEGDHPNNILNPVQDQSFQ